MMHDVNELWSSPWRDLQQNLASELDLEAGAHDRGEFFGPAQGKPNSAGSWLARGRKPRGSPRFQ
jgi:hypothetical protein